MTVMLPSAMGAPGHLVRPSLMQIFIVAVVVASAVVVTWTLLLHSPRYSAASAIRYNVGPGTNLSSETWHTYGEG